MPSWKTTELYNFKQCYIVIQLYNLIYIVIETYPPLTNAMPFFYFVVIILTIIIIIIISLTFIFFQDQSRRWMAASQQHMVDKQPLATLPCRDLLFSSSDTSIFKKIPVTISHGNGFLY